MKFITLRILIAVLTFGLGVTAFWIARKSYISAPIEVALPEVVQSVDSNLKETNEVILNKERFTFLGHACGNGWVQGYELPDGQRISTGLDAFGSSKEAESELSKTLSKAERIITTVEKYKKPSREIGKRTIAEFISEKTGKSVVGIFWRKKGEDSYEYIYAPTLEIALEFEKYQESQWK
jgi:hypothetical protein